jgi:hypothetical protein
MRLNADATAVLRESRAEQILLLWDDDKKEIALSVASKHDPRAFHFTSRLFYATHTWTDYISQFVRQT